MASDGYESIDVLIVSKVTPDREWILDSGCTFHMTPNKAWFEEFKQEDGGVVLLGNDKPCRVKGIGTVRIKMHNEVEKVLINVRFIHELKRNLISLGMLDDLGYVIRVESRILKILKGSFVD